MFFLSRRFNTRHDEYGGSLENRARLLKELIEETRDAVGDTVAVACRISVDELLGTEGLHAAEAREIIAHLAELPDLWDLTLSSWDNDSQTSRFAEEGYQEPFVTGIKQLTTKPVVGVGRLTSPDYMVKLIRSGVLDLIGAARPSIADPFLPNKIKEGRIDDIRECIGCNICVAGDHTMSPSRCTQNPSFGEEWRRGWHPERINLAASRSSALIVGAGPAGLEAAMMLGRRGYEVTLADKSRSLGGRLVEERRLPGLSAWGRVADYREGQINKLSNVSVYRESDLKAGDILDFGCDHAVIATGSTWRRDGIARYLLKPVTMEAGSDVLTPDDVLAGTRPGGKRVIIYDDDHYYMGGVLAELLVSEGYEVTLVTPAPDVSNWMRNTMEQFRVQARLLELGVEIIAQHGLAAVGSRYVELGCVFTGRRTRVEGDGIVLVTARLPRNALLQEVRERMTEGALKSVTVIGDAASPGTIAAAVFAGRRYAEELDQVREADAPLFRREITGLAEGPLPWKTLMPVKADDRL
jgi:dimethylamine/trimethylamine dehydrogenase